MAPCRSATWAVPVLAKRGAAQNPRLIFMSKSYIWGNPPENKTRSNKTHAGLFPAHSANRNPTTMRGLIALLAVIALSCFSQTDAQLANPGATGAAAKEGGLGGGLRCDQPNLARPDR